VILTKNDVVRVDMYIGDLRFNGASFIGSYLPFITSLIFLCFCIIS